jgi:circadian clock protein KaiC
MSANEEQLPAKVSTGIAGLDQILEGGLPHRQIYLVQGESGTGKTTVGLQFALAGLKAGETVLYIPLSETARELRQIAASHGWSLEGLHVHEVQPARLLADFAREQTIFHPAEVEMGEFTSDILQAIQTIRPERAVFDSVTELHLLAEQPLRYRRQLLSLRQVLIEAGCTTLLLNNESATPTRPIHSLVHGGIELERVTMDYGVERRRLRVTKMRAMSYEEGYHDFRIVRGGIVVYPRLRPAGSDQAASWMIKSSGLPELDNLLGGGVPSGTACLITGQTGTGKSTIATLYAYAAAQRGESSTVYIFDERLETFLRRAESIGLDLEQFAQKEMIALRQINAGEISPGEFSHMVQQAVIEENRKLVIIDSLTGYFQALPDERLLLTQIHELLTFLSQNDVLTLLTLTDHGILEHINADTIDLSYLADTVLVIRRFEARGSVRQAISVIKKRHGPHEKTIREMQITPKGVQVGQPLTNFSGVLSGRPHYEGEARQLFGSDEDEPKRAQAGAG